MEENCTIGYFKEDGKIYAGKNREPGKTSLDTMIIRSPKIKKPKLLYIGTDPKEKINLKQQIESAYEGNRIFDLDKLGVNLYKLGENEKRPSELEGILSENLWGGLYPNKRIGKPASSPTKPIYLLPSDSDKTVVGNASHYNLERLWGGVNDSGLFVQSSSIRHDNRLENRPSYSTITNEILKNYSCPEKASEFIEEKVKDYQCGAANFLLSNKDNQYIVEYLPSDVVDGNDPIIEKSSNLEKEFRTNFGLKTRFFKRKYWNLSNNKGRNEVENYIRSINRLVAAYDETSKNVFESHTVYDELFDKGILEEVVNSMYYEDLREISFSFSEDFASFYSICTHPVTKDEDFQTYKRTFWNMFANLTDDEVTLTYDNPCQAGAKIDISPKKIKKGIDYITRLEK